MKSHGKSLLVTLALLFSLTACKKYAGGCMDPEAENYSVYAKIDDGSCMYHASSDVTVSSWNLNDPYYSATITWAALTLDVIDRGSVSVYMVFPSSEIVELPYTYSSSTLYSSHWYYEASVGQVEIFRYDSDMSTPADPGAVTFRLVANWSEN